MLQLVFQTFSMCDLTLFHYIAQVTAFAGASLANMFFAWIEADFTAEESIRTLLNEIAGNLPGQYSTNYACVPLGFTPSS